MQEEQELVFKPISELEKETGFFLKYQHDGAELMDRDSFISMCRENDTTSINYTDRVLFLQNNGYAVTRENLLNSSLSAQPQNG